MRLIRWLWSHIFEAKETFDPMNDDYVGHNHARACGRAKCICPEGYVHIMCPFHGR